MISGGAFHKRNKKWVGCIYHTHTHTPWQYSASSRSLQRRRRRQTDRHLHIRRLSIWNWLSCWENCFAWLFFRQAPCWLTDFFSTAKSHYAPSARRLPLAAVRNSKFSLPLLRKKFRSARRREREIHIYRERCTLLPLAAIKGALEFERVTLCVCALSDILGVAASFLARPPRWIKSKASRRPWFLGGEPRAPILFRQRCELRVCLLLASAARALPATQTNLHWCLLDNFAERADAAAPYINTSWNKMQNAIKLLIFQKL